MITAPTTRRALARALPVAAIALAVAIGAVGCGDDDADEPATGSATETSSVTGGDAALAEGEILEASELRSCLTEAGTETGPAAPDAVVGDYAQEAIDEGGDSFVMQSPIAQVIVFADRVDLADAREQLRAAVRASEADSVRANGMQADAYGNVLVVYFVSGGADKAPVTECLGATAPPVPGLEAPYVPPELGVETPAKPQ